MFTGIVETLGKVENVQRDGTNIDFTMSCSFTNELEIDQSVAHNGACLTVVSIDGEQYKVTAIDETLEKTNLGEIKAGDEINLERCMKLDGRLDGHIVQGHVDATAICQEVEEIDGSWKFTFTYSTKDVTVPKGSITVNGVSLTVVDSEPGLFSVAIIPYTYKHTTFRNLNVGDRVNIEFDIIGKYVARLLDERN